MKKIDTERMMVFDRARLASSRVFSKTGLPSAALDKDGNVCVVYADVRSETAIEELRKNWAFEAMYGKWRFAPLYLKLRWHIFFSKIDPSGRLLVRDRPVERNPYSSSSPAIAVDSENILHIVYLEDDREQFRWIHVRSTSENSFPAIRELWDQSDKILQNLGLSLAFVPAFAVTNVLFLTSLLFFSILLWSLKRRAMRAPRFLHSPTILLGSYIILKYLVIALGYDRVVQFYPGGLSQLVTGTLAASIVLHGLKVTRARIESPSSYVVIASVWMLLDTFYNLCLISPIAIDPVY